MKRTLALTTSNYCECCPCYNKGNCEVNYIINSDICIWAYHITSKKEYEKMTGKKYIPIKT